MNDLAGRDEWMSLLASSLVGLAIAVACRWLLQSLATEEDAKEREWRYDVARMAELRRTDWVYRFFKRPLEALASINRGLFRGVLPEISREIGAAGLTRAWLPEEYLARCELLAILSMPLLALGLWKGLGVEALTLLPPATILVGYYFRRRLAIQARERLVQIHRRLPYLLDLLTLLMEAGSSFLQALRQATEEYRGQAVSTEFARVLADMNMGKPRTEAFAALRDRLRDDTVTSIIGSIIQGEQLGTPLARIFRTQADILRLKRSQRAEMIAGEAGVKMLLPGVLVMMSTILIILGPFVLNFLFSDVLW